MKTFFVFRRLVVVTIVLASQSGLLSAELPRAISSAACRTPPTIDGKIGPEEWRDATAIDFDLSMVKVKSSTFTTRACQLRVMNSANALYVALRVPDKVVNKSFNPVDFDFANLAFCRGAEVSAGDDRKAVAVGVYLDKHVTTPGKDADDKKQDGKGAMQHEAETGTYTIEWAIPLDSGDKEDVQAKPGDSLRFNVAYVDSFNPELRDTEMGSAYAGGLDHAKDWGTLKLASDVTDDGGVAFRGPDWVRKLIEGFSSAPANRLRHVETTTIGSPGPQVVKTLIEYNYRDPSGDAATGLAKLYLPAVLEHEKSQHPLYHAAGYELDDAGAVGLIARGFVVVTARSLESNPLVRTTNPDIALIHIARSLPFVNDAKVIVGGGSAGGYATLMVAAETFPLAGAAPDVPPINWGYNAAYFLQREKEGRRKNAGQPATPVFDVIVPIVQQALKVYGENTSSDVYFRNSPLAQLDTITCPVSVYWTTADMLVPINQVGNKWVRPIDTTKFPAEFTFDPDVLTTSDLGRKRLTDLLDESQYELIVITENEIKQRVTAGKPSELSVSKQKQWSITILDEGPPEPHVGHTKYAVPWSQRKFVDSSLEQVITADQLTAKKLQRLMDRYAGREWLPAKLVHLDDAASEQADVIRGLKTFVKLGPDHSKRFGELYSALPKESQVLPPAVLNELKSGLARSGN